MLPKIITIVLALLPQVMQVGVIGQTKPTSVNCGSPVSSTLAAWYKADAGVTATGGLMEGNAVTVWADQSGNGNDLTPGTSPSYTISGGVNGLPAILFTAASSQYLLLTSDIDNKAATTVFLVAKETSTGTKMSWLSGQVTSYTSWLDSGGKQQGADSAGTTLLGAGSAAASTNYFQLNQTYDGTTITMRLNRSADGSAMPVAVIGQDEDTLGRNHPSASEYMDGAIVEILVYTSVLSGGNITTNETYLNCRTGL